MSSTVSTKEVDYLDEDKPLRGQNYVCLSFISPEDILNNKEVYTFNRFLDQFSKDLDLMFQNLMTRYPDDSDLLKSIKETHSHIFDGNILQEQYRFFKKLNSGDIDREFLEQNDFRTSVRGIKVRGSFETLKEAQVRAEVLKRSGDKFDIYIGQVGCWCPWSPNPDDLQDQQYTETQLNTLMQKYKENMMLKDEFFEQRKREKVEDSLTQKDAWTKRLEEKQATEASTSTPTSDDTTGSSTEMVDNDTTPNA